MAVKYVERFKDETTLGQWDGMKSEISLKISPDIWEYFLHECIECINDRCDLRMKHHQIATLSEVLYAVIKENGIDFR